MRIVSTINKMHLKYWYYENKMLNDIQVKNVTCWSNVNMIQRIKYLSNRYLRYVIVYGECKEVEECNLDRKWLWDKQFHKRQSRNFY